MEIDTKNEKLNLFQKRKRISWRKLGEKQQQEVNGVQGAVMGWLLWLFLTLLGLVGVLSHGEVNNVDVNIELARLEECKTKDLSCLLKLLEWHVKLNDDGKVERELQTFMKKNHALDYDATFCTLLHLFVSSRAVKWQYSAAELNELKHLLSLDYVLQDHGCDANIYIRNQRNVYSSDARFMLSSLHEECNNPGLVDYLVTNKYKIHPCQHSDSFVCRDFTIDTPPPTETLQLTLFDEFIGAASVFDLLHHVYNGQYIVAEMARPFRVLFPEYFNTRNLYTFVGFIQRNYVKKSLPSPLIIDVVAADRSVVNSINALLSRCLNNEVPVNVIHSSLHNYLRNIDEQVQYDYIEYNVASLNDQMQDYLTSFLRHLSPIGSVGLTFFARNEHQDKLATLVSSLPASVASHRRRQLLNDYLVHHNLDLLQSDHNLIDFLQENHNCTNIHTGAKCAYSMEDVTEILRHSGYRILSKLPLNDVSLLKGVQRLKYSARGVTDPDLSTLLLPVFRNTLYITSTNSSTQLRKVDVTYSFFQAHEDRVMLITRTGLLEPLVPKNIESKSPSMELLIQSYGGNEVFIKRFPSNLVPLFALLPAGVTLDQLLAHLLAIENSQYDASTAMGNAGTARLSPTMREDVLSLLLFLERLHLLSVYISPVNTADTDRGNLASVYPESIAAIMNTSSGSNTAVITNVLPTELFDELVNEVRSMPQAQRVYGAASFYVPVHNHTSRNKLEYLILNHLAPLVIGSAETMAHSWKGIEWWIQYRDPNDSKEFHLDTAISYCRDMGYESLDRCPFYPAVGTVFYLDEVGGPTVVMDQVMSACGLSPPIPESITVVHPERNKMLLFRGDLLHGVLNSNAAAGKRLTLLVNYWKGEIYAGGVDTYRSDEEGVLQLARLPINAINSHLVVHPSTYMSEYNFVDDIEYWQHQQTSPSLLSIHALQGAQYVIMSTTPNYINKHFEWIFNEVVKKCDNSFVVGNWKYWEHSLHTSNKSVTPLLAINNRLPYVYYKIQL